MIEEPVWENEIELQLVEMCFVILGRNVMCTGGEGILRVITIYQVFKNVFKMK